MKISKQTYDLIVKYAKSVSKKTPGLWEDVAQEACIDILKYNSEIKTKSFYRTVVLNRYIIMVKKHNSGKRIDTDYMQVFPLVTTINTDGLCSKDFNKVLDLRHKPKTKAVLDCLMNNIGMSYVDMAKLVGMNKDTFKTHLRLIRTLVSDYKTPNF